MTPATFDIAITKGITFGPVLIQAKDSNNAAVDLTGWSVWADVRKSAAKPVEFSLNPTISDPEAGQITIAFTDEQTNELPAGAWAYDLVLENPSGERIGPYLAGAVTITTPITRPA